MILPSAGRPFVGRERELATLRAALERATGGMGQVVLIGGEPGIGKTRLADELSAIARGDDVGVLWGRAWEGGGAPAFWPWVQVVRALLRDDPSCEPDVVPPELRAWRHPTPAGPAPDGAHERFALFDATVACLRDVGRRRPTMIVLDDLHAADLPSLRLLQFVARALREMAVLLVGTYRDVEARRDEVVTGLLTDVAREGEALALGGLDADAIGHFVAARTGAPPSGGIVVALRDATGGNPFFLDEMVRLLGPATLDRLPRVPQRVRDTVRRRLEPLPPVVRDALAVAAVIGHEVERDVLEAASGLAAADLQEALDVAVDAGIVVASGARGRFRFVHALIRETVYDGIGLVRRTAMHGDVGAVLARLHADDLEPHRAALAHHFLTAAEAGGDVTPAVEHAQAAGSIAMQALAFEEAVTHCERALRLLRRRSDHVRTRCELGLALASAHRHAGDLDAARRALAEATELARGLDAMLLARAALEAGGAGVTLGHVDEGLVCLLEEALAAIGEADGALRARLLARLAMELCYADDTMHERRVTLSQQAIEMAERLGDWQALGYALTCRHVACMGPGNVVERHMLASAIVQVARRTGDRETAAEGHGWRIFALLELGDLPSADADIATLGRLGLALRQPHYQWLAAMFRAMRAIVAGRHDEGEQLAGEALAQGQRAQDPNAFPAYASQLYILRWQQGRLRELAAWMPGFADEHAQIHAWRTALAHLQATTGDHVPARRAFGPLCDEVATLPRDITWLTSVTLLADTCVALGAVERAERLHAMLLPFAARNLVTGSGSACMGAATRHLGRLATLLRRHADAEANFLEARRLHETMGARPWMAFTLRDHARLLAGRDDARAHALLDQARLLATELALGDDFADVEPPPPRGTLVEVTPARDRGICRLEGDYWLLEFRGAGSRLRDAKGMRILAHLLHHPGREFHAADLTAVSDGRHAPEGARSLGRLDDDRLAGLGMHAGGLGDAGELLDPQARGDYRRRLVEIDRQLAEPMGDGERLLAERDFILRELGGGTGLGGRGRRAAAASERARVSVTRALRAVLGRIAAGHDTLGEHLASTIRTGTFCAYEPDPRVPIVWTS